MQIIIGSVVFLKEAVKEELKKKNSNKETLSLSDEIFDWCDEGGPRLIKDNIQERIKEIRSHVNKDIKIIKEKAPAVKKKVRKRSSRKK